MPSPRLDVSTHAFPSESAVARFVVWPSAPGPSSASSSAWTRVVGARVAERRQARERLGDAGEPGAGQEPVAGPADLGRLLPAGLVALEVAARHGDPLDTGDEHIGDRPRVRAVRPLGRQELERTGEPGLVEQVAGLERPPRRGVDAPAVRLHREDRRQHGEARGVGGRHRDAAARDPERRLDEPRPRQPAEARVQRSEPARNARHRAGPGTDGVVDELLAEGDFQLDRRCAGSRGHVDEEVEIPGVAPVPVDRMPTAEQAGHHRLGDAGCEAGRNRRVGGRAPVLEDLDPGRHRGGVACSDAGSHAAEATGLELVTSTASGPDGCYPGRDRDLGRPCLPSRRAGTPES